MLDPVDSGWRGSHHRFGAAFFPMLCCPTSERRKENKVAVCWSFHVTALAFVYERDNFARDVGRVFDIAASISMGQARPRGQAPCTRTLDDVESTMLCLERPFEFSLSCLKFRYPLPNLCEFFVDSPQFCGGLLFQELISAERLFDISLKLTSNNP